MLPRLVFTLALPFALTQAQSSTGNSSYTVWSSVVFLRSGDRTPLVLGNDPTTLTSLGAQQMYSVGQFFRSRYLNDPSTNQSATAPIVGLNTYDIDNLQTYVATLDEEYTITGAQAFMQGMYPPYALNRSLGSTYTLADGTYIENPLGGMNFPQIRTSSDLDPDYIYLGGSLDCPALDLYTEKHVNLSLFADQAHASQSIYQNMASFLDDVIAPADQSFYNAWAIYDYLSYLYTHNSTVANQLALSTFTDSTTNTSYLDSLRYYADVQQTAYFGNLTAVNPYGVADSTASGSISTIAGATLAAKVLSLLNDAITSDGKYYKLSVLVGDYDPMLSFFALMGLSNLNSNFLGLPEYASAMVFELFSYTSTSSAISNTNGGSAAFPDPSDLWVRFSFRNGSAPSVPSGQTDTFLESFPLFDLGPSDTDILLSDFVAEITKLTIADPGEWCTQCGAQNIFCAAWNSSDAYTSSTSTSSSSSKAGPTDKSKHISGPVAGVIGAVLALFFAGLLAGLLALLAGVRVHRVEVRQRPGGGPAPRNHSSSLGGFKGSAKLASDTDLTRPQPAAFTVTGSRKGADAVVGASFEAKNQHDYGDSAPRERVGSWELKSNAKDTASFASSGGAGGSPRHSFESVVDPFRDPVKIRESV